MTPQPTYLDNEFRQIFRNLSIPDRTLGIDPAGWVRYGKRMGARVAFMDARSQFYANHESAFIPKDPGLGDRDLLAEFAAAARKYGIKHCAYIPPCTVESLEHGHDHWQQRTADGAKECRNWGFWRTVFCYNTGFGELYAQHLHEVAEKYRPYGFFIDGVIYGFSACYCNTCRERFRAESGQDMPATPDWTAGIWHDYVAWRYRQVEKVGRMIGEAVHSVDPKIAVVWNCGFPVTGWYGGESPAMARWMDFACIEMLPSGNWWGMFEDGYTYVESLGWGISVNRAIQFGRTASHYSYFTPATRRAEIQVTADTACAFGATSCLQEHSRHTADYFQRFRAAEPWLVDAGSAADIALHYSVKTQNAYIQPDGHADRNRMQRDVRGIYKALLNAHRTPDILTDEGLEASALDAYRAILLPNSVCLSPAAVNALRSYVRAGGCVVGTLETGLRTIRGERAGTDLFWKGSGLKFEGEIPCLSTPFAVWHPDRAPDLESDLSANPDQFLMFETRAVMKKWMGEDITLGQRPDGFERREIHQFLETPSVHVSARAVAVRARAPWKTVLAMRIRRDRKRGFETIPAVVERRLGRGRLLYVNFQLGEQAAQCAHPWWRQFIATLTERSAGRAAVRIEAPPCVKATLWKQPSEHRHVLHLVNELSGTGTQNVQREERVPVPVAATITLPGVRSVRVVVGGESARVARKGRTWRVDLPRLAERAIVECAG